MRRLPSNSAVPPVYVWKYIPVPEYGFYSLLIFVFWTAVARIWSMSMSSWGGSASVMPVRHSSYNCWLYHWFYSRQHLSLEHVHEFVAGSICDARAAQLRRLCVSMCTFVLVKRVNWAVICEIPVRYSCSFCVGICTFVLVKPVNWEVNWVPAGGWGRCGRGGPVLV